VTQLQHPTATASRPPRYGLYLLAAQAVLLGVYAALIIAPYFAHGLHNEPADRVEGGWFDPKGLWPDNGFGTALSYAAAASGALTWLAASYVAVVAVAAGAATWRRSGWAERGRFVAVVVLAVAFLAYQFSAFGGHISAWMAD
jgi:hypothetical protein